MVPFWLHVVSILSIGLGFLCAFFIVIDVIRHPQHMWIVNVVWPVTALFGSVIAVWAYLRYGRLATHRKTMEAKEQGEDPPSKRLTPFPMIVAKGAAHCGSGCTLGDIIAEWLAFGFPVVATWFGWKSLFAEDHKLFSVWILDFIVAFLIGMAFQYFTIKPMRNLSVKDGLIQAVKADTLSLAAWQVGMYGFMAIAHFWICAHLLGAELRVTRIEFWFMMQIAMLFGFATSYPVNWWLISKGVKEKM